MLDSPLLFIVELPKELLWLLPLPTIRLATGGRKIPSNKWMFLCISRNATKDHAFICFAKFHPSLQRFLLDPKDCFFTHLLGTSHRQEASTGLGAIEKTPIRSPPA